jgi:hypothetical protein
MQSYHGVSCGFRSGADFRWSTSRPTSRQLPRPRPTSLVSTPSRRPGNFTGASPVPRARPCVKRQRRGGHRERLRPHGPHRLPAHGRAAGALLRSHQQHTLHPPTPSRLRERLSAEVPAPQSSSGAGGVGLHSLHVTASAWGVCAAPVIRRQSASIAPDLVAERVRTKGPSPRSNAPRTPAASGEIAPSCNRPSASPRPQHEANHHAEIATFERSRDRVRTAPNR